MEGRHDYYRYHRDDHFYKLRRGKNNIVIIISRAITRTATTTTIVIKHLDPTPPQFS